MALLLTSVMAGALLPTMAQFREVAAAMLLPLAIFYPLAVLIIGTLLQIGRAHV